MDTQIEYHGPTDTHGRCHFSLRWIDDYFPGHPEGEHVRRERGQHFHAEVKKQPPDLTAGEFNRSE